MVSWVYGGIKMTKTTYWRLYKRKWRKNNPKWLDNHPWYRTLSNIHNRCNRKCRLDYKWYGGRGIKVLLTANDLKKLWFRDKAFLLKEPSIDRIDSNKDYTKNNCQYIEKRENIRGSKIKW